jgi:hypothetical protein
MYPKKSTSEYVRFLMCSEKKYRKIFKNILIMSGKADEKFPILKEAFENALLKQ